MAISSPITNLSQVNLLTLTPSELAVTAIHLALRLDEFQPNLPQSQISAFNYAVKTVSNSNFDGTLCRQAGKVVHIVAKFLQETQNQVGIRGDAPLHWQSDQAEDPSSTPNFLERAFTFHVLPSQMNNTIEFKFCIPDHVRNGVIWSSGANYSIDLKEYGHIAIIHVKDVSFSK